MCSQHHGRLRIFSPGSLEGEQVRARSLNTHPKKKIVSLVLNSKYVLVSLRWPHRRRRFLHRCLLMHLSE
jgi:hypothetical protein